MGDKFHTEYVLTWEQLQPYTAEQTSVWIPHEFAYDTELKAKAGFAALQKLNSFDMGLRHVKLQSRQVGEWEEVGI